MAEDLSIIKGSKEEQYKHLIPQIKALMEGEENLIANQGNVCAALKEQFKWLWIGFYMIEDENTLVLGPFQGPVACTRIKKGKGVCGRAWAQEKILIVPDVDAFPGHIACSSLSKSEIVLPYYREGSLIGILDVDSEALDNFDKVDEQYLSTILTLIGK